MFAILTFGDSIVQGRMSPATRGWAQFLKEEFEKDGDFQYLFNLGIPGETTHTLLKHMGAECDARHHHKREGDRVLILIGIGTNDAKSVGEPNIHETIPEQFRKNVHELIHQAKIYTDSVVLIGLLPVDESKVNPYETTWFTNDRQREYNTIIKEVCDWEKVLFIDLFDGWMKSDYLGLLEDGLHPNEAGHFRLYREIKDFLDGRDVL